MYSVNQLKRAFLSPKLVLHELNRLYYRRGYSRGYNTAGVDVFEEDWDNLVVLDACRYDMYRDIVTDEFAGTISSRTSRGSSTPEWLRGNFHQRDLNDTVYVTANPNLYRNSAEFDVRLHEIVNVWLDEGWDEQYETVRPATTTGYAISAAESYSDKRLIVHYMQPHYPFISDENSFYDTHQSLTEGTPHFWQELMAGTIEIEQTKIWKAYRDNLQTALEPVVELTDELDGKTVITSDHGNMINERAFPLPIREWGHPPGIYTKQLVTVPWHELPFETRREIRPGDSQEINAIDEGVVSDRLESLGYKS